MSRESKVTELERRLQTALSERDRALEALAEARAELNRLRMQAAHPGEAAPGAWTEGGRPALPLRYRLADRLNDGARSIVGPGHALLKQLLTRR